jgi:hypothetical protein
VIGIHVKTRSYAELARKRARGATFRNLNHAAATLRLSNGDSAAASTGKVAVLYDSEV